MSKGPANEALRRETEESFRAHQLKRRTDREIRASPPRPGAEPMRVAYLELLKLSLCDLAGARTLSVSRTGDTRRPDVPVFSRELDPEELRLRVMGGDWPFSGLTMIGLERLDDLQACIESVIADRVAGDVIEAGTWRGGAAILARATLDSLGEHDRTVVLADSFRGIPAPDEGNFPEDVDLDLSRVDFLSASADEVQSHFNRFGLEHGIEFVPGFFSETLPGLRDRRWSVVRLDGDTYEATWIGLESLYPGLSRGGYLIIDDYGLIPECRAAVEDFRRDQGITDPIAKADWNGVHWRREDEPDSAPPGVPSPRRRAVSTPHPPGGDARRARIPTERELALERELSDLRARLDPAAGKPAGEPR
jgi:O-methyltransferase